MKREPHFQPPRQSVIYGYTRRMLDETGGNASTFAMALAEAYTARVAPDVRAVPLRLGEGDDLYRAMKNNAQILRRFMDGSVKVLPADLEDAWVGSLPEPYRSNCERDLAARRGLLMVRPARTSMPADVATVATLLKEMGELCEALAPAITEGRISAEVVSHAQRIVREADDVLSIVIALKQQAAALLPKGELDA